MNQISHESDNRMNPSITNSLLMRIIIICLITIKINMLTFSIESLAGRLVPRPMPGRFFLRESPARGGSVPAGPLARCAGVDRNF